MPSNRQRVRKTVLARHGLRERKYRGPELDVREPPRLELVTDGNPAKTPLMRRIERQYGIRIEEVLVSGSLTQVAEALDIDFTTVSKWKKRLGL